MVPRLEAATRQIFTVLVLDLVWKVDVLTWSRSCHKTLTFKAKCNTVRFM